MVSTASLLASTEWVKVAARQQQEDETESQAVVSAWENDGQEISTIFQCDLDWIFSPLAYGVTSAFGGFPENQNPLVSLSLQHKLDEKSPREYLTAVLHDLSLEERDSLMVDEKQRRKTFLVNWPHDGNLSGEKMAQAGFYCVGDYDKVQCVFCRGSIHKWDPEDIPMTEHARYFPFCRFIEGLDCGNRECKNDVLPVDDLKNITYLCHPGFYCAGSLREWAKDDDPWMEHARWFPDCSYLVQLKGEAYIEHIHAITPEGKKCSCQTELKKKTEKQYMQRVSVQQEMVKLCLKLGHEKEVIDEVMQLNGGIPYDSIIDMIDMLYKVEERQLFVSDQVDEVLVLLKHSKSLERRLQILHKLKIGDKVVEELLESLWHHFSEEEINRMIQATFCVWEKLFHQTWKILVPVQRLIAANCQPDVVRLHLFERGHRSRFINQDRKRRVTGYESELLARQVEHAMHVPEDAGWFPEGCSWIITSPASVPLLPNANLDCEGDKLANPSLEQPNIFQIVENQDAPLLFTLAVELTAFAVNAVGLWVSMVSTASLLASTEWVKVAARQQQMDENENQAVVSARENDGQEISTIFQCGLDWIFSPQSHGVTSAFGGHQHLECYVLARFPENQNPLVSLSLQRKLDEKSPREYLTAVLHDLSLEERDSLMVDEKQRRKTFLVNWPHDGNLSGEKMAQAGFYCVDDYDRVQCVFCRGSLHKWDPEDIPMTEHARSFPFCRFIKGLDCGNREYKNDVLPVDDLKNITYLCHPDMKKNRDGTISTNSSAFGISTNKAQMIRYAPYETRKATFAKWPTANKIGPEKLIEAGFYYIGFDDTVRCFYCAGSLREWAKDDDPWMEHARWFPDCSYLVQLKGEIYIEHIHAITPEGKKCSRQTELEKKTEKEYKQRVSVQQALEEFCLKLGHEREAIDEVMLLNDGVPYDKPRDMIEMLYKVEERQLPASDHMESGYETLSINLKDRPKQMVMANEDLRKLLAGEDQVDKDVTMVDAMPDVKVPAATCHTCYRKTNQPVPAIYVGLPCGHLIYCESCKADERKKCDNSASYKSKCASRGCQTVLSGLIKCYVN